MTQSTNKKIWTFVRDHACELILAFACLLTYIPTFFWMWDRWFTKDSYYSHGILIPFVTGYLIWQKRKELQAIKQKSSSWGIRLIVLGILIHVVSCFLRVYFTSGFSMIIVLAGLIEYFYGKKVLREVAFPVAFLIFMVPVPMVVIADISFKMKILAAKIAAVVLNHMRMPAIRDGSLIRMQHANVMVDDVCSGLRSLISLAALGSIFAYQMRLSRIKKIFLFLSSLPIAVVTNVCRIVFLATISEIWGPQYAVGFIHDFSGFMVFAIAFILLFATGRLME